MNAVENTQAKTSSRNYLKLSIYGGLFAVGLATTLVGNFMGLSALYFGGLGTALGGGMAMGVEADTLLTKINAQKPPLTKEAVLAQLKRAEDLGVKTSSAVLATLCVGLVGVLAAQVFLPAYMVFLAATAAATAFVGLSGGMAYADWKSTKMQRELAKFLTTETAQTAKNAPVLKNKAAIQTAPAQDVKEAFTQVTMPEIIQTEEPYFEPLPVFTWRESLLFTKAVQTGDLKTLNNLIDTFGLDADVNDQFGFTTLMHAITFQQKAVVELLLDRGYSPNEKSRKTKAHGGGSTALMSAVGRGDVEMAQILIKKGAQVDAVNNEGNTAMDIAMSRNNQKMAMLLIDNGTSMEARDKTGATPLMNAVLKGDQALAERMLKVIYEKDPLAKALTVNMCDGQGRSALSIAAEKGNTDMVLALLRNDAVLEQKYLTALQATRPGLADVITNWPKIRERLNAAKISELQQQVKEMTERAGKHDKNIHLLNTRMGNVASKLDRVAGRTSDMDVLGAW